MSTIEVNKITPVSGGTAIQVGESGDTITIPSGCTITNSGTANNFGDSLRPNAEPIIINGDMKVAQRGTSFTGVSSGSNWPVDRFEFYPANLGAYTIIQEALTSGEAYNNGFRTALRIDTTTADASPAASDYSILRTKFEGQDLQSFKKGTSNAEKFTLAFWVKSNKTTTGQVNLFDIDNDRLVSGTYTISSANTWEKKIINFPADTTGAFDDNTALSLIVEFFLDSGSNFSSGTAPTAWEAQTNADRNANNFAIGSSTDNDFAITGVQLEVGEFTSATIPPFQHEKFGNNIVRCKRYYQQIDRPSYGDNTVLVGITTNGNQMFMVRLPVSMRSAPTISMTGTVITVYSTNSSANVSASNPTLSAGTFGTDGGRLLYAKIGDNGHGSWVDIDNNNTHMSFDAEI
tara:strand:- start:374 stop:1585 length:1212 start_codon:yes stop_codon:yes gene_type:complete